MDKFRALEYFVAAAEEGSFSGAARRLEVTIPAALKTIRSLEKALGVVLFDRSAQGLTLTADGSRYLEDCRPILEQLADADDSIRSAATRTRGTVVLGIPSFSQEHDLMPALPRFHARHPEINLDVRNAVSLTEPDAAAIDVFLLWGWHEGPDFVQRRVAQTTYHVIATPAYWKSQGRPKRPRDLAGHRCLTFRNPMGTLLDFWEFERGDEHESVSVAGWLTSSNPDLILAAAFAGEGVARLTSLRIRDHVARGDVETVLDEWTIRHPPPITIFFRPQHRRTARVRCVVDFLSDIFSRLPPVGGPDALSPTHPDWYYRRFGRASRAAKKRA